MTKEWNEDDDMLTSWAYKQEKFARENEKSSVAYVVISLVFFWIRAMALLYYIVVATSSGAATQESNSRHVSVVPILYRASLFFVTAVPSGGPYSGDSPNP